MRTDTAASDVGDFRGQPCPGRGALRRAAGRRCRPAAASCMKSGSLRVRFPSPEAQGLSAVFVNTAGGDRRRRPLRHRYCEPARDARLAVTTAAAEKIYRAARPAARTQCRARRPRPARISPGCRRRPSCSTARGCVAAFDIDLAESASLLLCEIVVFGRAAMGERMLHGRIRRPLAAAPRRPAGVRRKHPARRRHRRKAGKPRDRQRRRRDRHRADRARR